MPHAKVRKFDYAVVWAIATQHRSFETTEDVLYTYYINIFHKWRLQSNPTKSEVSCFHFCNRAAGRQLNVKEIDLFIICIVNILGQDTFLLRTLDENCQIEK